MKANKAIIFNGDLYIARHDANWLRGGTCDTWCALWDKGKKKCAMPSVCDRVNGRYFERKKKSNK